MPHKGEDEDNYFSDKGDGYFYSRVEGGDSAAMFEAWSRKVVHHDGQVSFIKPVIRWADGMWIEYSGSYGYHAIGFDRVDTVATSISTPGDYERALVSESVYNA